MNEDGEKEGETIFRKVCAARCVHVLNGASAPERSWLAAFGPHFKPM